MNLIKILQKIPNRLHQWHVYRTFGYKWFHVVQITNWSKKKSPVTCRLSISNAIDSNCPKRSTLSHRSKSSQKYEYKKKCLIRRGKKFMKTEKTKKAWRKKNRPGAKTSLQWKWTNRWTLSLGMAQQSSWNTLRKWVMEVLRKGLPAAPTLLIEINN